MDELLPEFQFGLPQNLQLNQSLFFSFVTLTSRTKIDPHRESNTKWQNRRKYRKNSFIYWVFKYARDVVFTYLPANDRQ